MSKQLKPYLVLISAALAAVTAACGGGVTATGPDAAAEAPARGGATIQGTVVSGTAAAPAPVGVADASGVRVSVVGTPLQVMTDGSGRFTLAGVPEGQVELRFEGPGVDARLVVDGLVAGQTLTLTVHVTGNSAARVDDDGAEVEIRGKVESVAGSSLVVAGRTVLVTPGTTRILDRQGQAIPLGGLTLGVTVEVEGVAQTDGSVLATRIRLEDDENEDEHGDDNDNQQEVEFKGSITSLGPLVIAGRAVTTDASTRFLDHRSEAVSSGTVLQLGNRVEVEGRQTGTSVLARKIKLED